ncbi:MAG: hypothetical protein M5U27_04115 [Gaiella sp.]|nr:hypothetical protein [Gaiella sp.]
MWRRPGPFGAARLAALGVSATSLVLYAFAARDEARVFRSADDGRTWSERGTLSTGSGPTWQQQHRDAGTWLRALAVDAGNVATDDHVYRTTDGGRSWQRLDGFGAQVVAMAVDPSGTVYRSLDGGRTWRRIDTGPLTDTKYPQFAVDPRNPALVYAAVYANLEPAKGPEARYGEAVLKSVDGGSTWKLTNATGGLLGGLTVDPLSPARIYVGGGHDGALLRSDNAGASWRPTGRPPGGVAHYALDPRRQGRLWAVSTGWVLSRSDDAGRSWTRVALLDPPAGARTVWLDPASERIYAGVQGLGLYGAAFPR